jgi:hypothetical protein
MLIRATASAPRRIQGASSAVSVETLWRKMGNSDQTMPDAVVLSLVGSAHATPLLLPYSSTLLSAWYGCCCRSWRTTRAGRGRPIQR